MSGLVSKGRRERQLKSYKGNMIEWNRRRENNVTTFKKYSCCGNETVGIMKGDKMVCPKCLKELK